MCFQRLRRDPLNLNRVMPAEGWAPKARPFSLRPAARDKMDIIRPI